MISQKKILVIEDSEINRAMLSEILSSEYQVLEAENGQEGLSVLKQYGQAISLIMLDIVMPVMDGYTFLSLVKADKSLASIPVIVTTQSDDESNEVAALSHGAADFVAKPYKSKVILHRAANIINLRETAAFMNQAQYDALTGLYSKEFFYQRAKDIFLQYPEKNYDIICSDIENFKLFNDIFGIPAGNRLLCGVADLYKESIGSRGICGRFNADQFVCMIEHLTDYTDEMFVEAGMKVNELENAQNIVMKWGVYTVENKEVPIGQMCDRALLAAASIKGKYGKHFAAYDDELRSKLLMEQAITDSMETALLEGQFEIFLQPKYKIKDDRLAGAEALVRWRHPEWGLQPPSNFIPLFERNGFITKLDRYIWDKACSILAQWREKGYPEIPVSVNVSRADIYNENITDILIQTVRKYDLQPALLHLEITESAYTENPDQIIETVDRLRALGFVIEMDDFGSGYSSLNMLNKMSLDILKLDMVFIQNETAKPAEQGILRFIMDLARWMNLSVIAEGVETKKQLERLREIGCDYVQGYYFSKPVPCPEFEALIMRQCREWTKAENKKIEEHVQYSRQIILIADEDEAYRAEIRQPFESKYDVIEAGDIETAYAQLVKNEERIAAAILSLTMAGEEKCSILKLIQKDRQIWNIPVVATAPSDPYVEEKALRLGADDFAGKPHLGESLYRRVMRTLGQTAARERENVLKEEANKDYLTGILNRRGLEEAVKSLRNDDMPVAVYLIDLDNLKSVNDNFGHLEGDKLIQKFAELLQMNVRASDILSRYGGDEFIIITKQMHSEEIVLQKGKTICEKIRTIQIGKEFVPTCSIGIALWQEGESIIEITKRADKALYCAKSNYKGNSCLWRTNSEIQGVI